MKEIDIIKLAETIRFNETKDVLMIIKHEGVDRPSSMKLQFNSIEKSVTIADKNSKDTKDVSVIIQNGIPCISLENVKFYEEEPGKFSGIPRKLF